jgi:hypothetical protein
MKLFYVSIMLIYFISACTAPKVSTNSININIHNLAYSSLNIDAMNFEYNESKDFLLGIFQNDNSVDPSILKYVVIDIKKESVIHKESIPNGKVKWISDYKIQIINPPGIVKNPSESLDENTTILNVRTGEKVKKGATL